MDITDIYYEHIEEAAFLYEQRNNIFSDPEGDLEYQLQIEERLEAHIDALELGAGKSVPVLKKYIDSDDEGEYFTVVYSLLRMNNERDEVFQLFENEAVKSITALCHV